MRFLTIIRNSSSEICSSLHQPTIVLVHEGIFQSLCEDFSNVETSIIWVSTRNFIPSRNSESIISSLETSSQSDWKIPIWTKTIVGWWNEDQLSDDEFLSIIKNLVEREIIVV